MDQEKISIRRWSEEDWRVFREMRLEALRINPTVFLGTIEKEGAADDEYWRKTLRERDQSAVFGLYDQDRVIGLTGAFRFRDRPEDTVIFGMSFIHPDYRRRGLSRLFYQARIDWAKSQSGITRIIIGHREDNIASYHANQKWGFQAYDREEIVFGDGTKAVDIRYELKLERSS